MRHLEPHRLTHLRFPGLVAMDVSGTSILTSLCGFDDSGHVTLPDRHVIHCRTPVFDEVQRTKHGDLEGYFERVLVDRMDQQVRTLCRRHPGTERLPVAISFSGQIDPDGRIHSASSIFRGAKPAGGSPLNLPRLLRLRNDWAHRELRVINNVSAAAWRLSLDPHVTDDGQVRSFAVLHIGSGFGSKIFNVDRGFVLMDDRGFAGELGHVRMETHAGCPPGLTCDCGGCDHLASIFLPEGLRRICGGALARCGMLMNQHPADGLREMFTRSDRAAEARDLVGLLATTLASTLAPVLPAAGIGRVVLKGSFFFRVGPRACAHFLAVLHRELRARLEPYFPIGRDFLLLYAADAQFENVDAYERHDRQLGIEGLAAFTAAQHRSAAGVNTAHFAGHPCHALSCSDDIRYPVIRSAGIFDPGNPLLQELTLLAGTPRRLVVVIDKRYDLARRCEVVAAVRHYFEAAGRTVADGEHPDAPAFERADVLLYRIDPTLEDPSGRTRENKTPEQVLDVVAWCRQSRLPRDGMLVAIGGGVTLDIVGFAALQYRRMVSYLRIPTTLIGQVDAGVGVKVGVNYGTSKNLIGAFYPPFATVNDPTFLLDLDHTQMRCGLAEIVKMAIIADAGLVAMLEELGRILPSAVPIRGAVFRDHPSACDQLAAIADAAIHAMMVELQANLLERDLRRLVDFGHTFGPKIESASDYRVPHGLAVAIDMYLCCQIAARLGGVDPGRPLIMPTLLKRYVSIMRRFGLIVWPKLGDLALLEQHRDAIFHQAVDDGLLHRGGRLNLVVPVAVPGRGGFIDLSGHSSANEYVACRSREELHAAFVNAVAALRREAVEEAF